MRIVSNPEFLTLPNGTLYCRYESPNLGPVEIKGDSSDEMCDFLFQELVQTALVGDAFDKYMREGNPVGKKFDLYEGDCWGRDGEYDEEAMYAIFEKKDITQIIEKLLRCNAQAYTA
jgi:hypothetical protein